MSVGRGIQDVREAVYGVMFPHQLLIARYVLAGEQRATTMTLIVGMNLGDYALLGADKRVVCKHPDGRVEYDDEAAKICKFDFGSVCWRGIGIAGAVCGSSNDRSDH